MDRIEADATPAEDWLQSLNATCNRLSTQYLNLLRAASSVTALEQGRLQDPRGSYFYARKKMSMYYFLVLHLVFCIYYHHAAGGHMPTQQDPPPPALAADVAMSSVQCQLAAENICVATSHLLSLIRTLRLSILLMDDGLIAAEEEWQVQEAQAMTQDAQREAVRLEQELMTLRNNQLQ